MRFGFIFMKEVLRDGSCRWVSTCFSQGLCGDGR
jgi:hypothetical protein